MAAGLLTMACLLAPTTAQTITPDEAPVTAQTETVTGEAETKDFLRPNGGRFGLGGAEGFGLGTALSDPSSFLGPERVPAVLLGTSRVSTFDIQGYYARNFNDNLRFVLEASGDTDSVDYDGSFILTPDDWNGAFAINLWGASGRFSAFNSDAGQAFLPGGNEPFLQEFGGGVEYVHQFSEKLDIAFGVNYAQYGFSDNLFSGTRFPVDENGFPITASGLGSTERFLGPRISGSFSDLNNRDAPTQGTKIRFAAEQGIGIGDVSTSYSRFATNIAHLIDAPGFNDGEHSFLLNIQTGVIFGDPPLIRAFHLGGPNSVRGYSPGELASGDAFFQSSIEYRHHLFSFNALGVDVDTRFESFVDYATNLGTTDNVPGLPPQLLEKENNGSSFGLGLGFGTDFGLFRIGGAQTNQGDVNFFFSAGERF